MESIIKKAMEGGYKYSCAPTQFQPIGDGMTCNFTGVNSQWACWNRDDNDSTICVPHSETILDPLFWQSLGKACGWEQFGKHSMKGNNLRCSECGEKPHTGTGRCSKNWTGDWQSYALRFHEINLTEGWDKAVDYLLGLIK